MQIISDYLDLSNTMYPCEAYHIKDNKSFFIEKHSTAYGYQISGTSKVVFNKNDSRLINAGQYFCLTSINEKLKIKNQGEIVLFIRIGFKGQNLIGGPTEKSGRLVYIDGCSDSLLVYPPRCGDPSISLLYFPENIQQTFHVHPSIRLGVIIEGNGIAEIKNANGNISEKELNENTVFYIEERELHRFKTQNSHLKIIAFHPDGDWGPTDENHTMLNRTYIK